MPRVERIVRKILRNFSVTSENCRCVFKLKNEQVSFSNEWAWARDETSAESSGPLGSGRKVWLCTAVSWSLEVSSWWGPKAWESKTAVK